MTDDMNAKDMYDLMKQFFDPTELSALWGRFGTLVHKSGGVEEGAWQKICKLGWREGKMEAKGKVLAMQLARPSVWKNFMVQEVNMLTRTETKRQTKTRYYPGELKRVHAHRTSTSD